VFLPIFHTGDGVLWDYLGLLVAQLFLMGAIIYVLYQTTFTNPGRLDPAHPAYLEYRKLYELAIGGGLLNDDDDDNPTEQEVLQLCHSCHIARPLRSKHCRITGTCVLAFDHHCPFVGTTVGLYNVRTLLFFIPFLFVWLSSLCYIITSPDDNGGLLFVSEWPETDLPHWSVFPSSSSLLHDVCTVSLVLFVPVVVDDLSGQLFGIVGCVLPPHQSSNASS
jgi:DHHC palmitoyltransferase